MAAIHPTAIVDSKADLADDVRIGPYAIIQGRVSISPGTIIEAHSVIRGHTVIGPNCRIGPASYVGLDPQHQKYDGAETSLVIGEDTTIRETTSLHRSMKPGIENATRVGKRCFIMGASHVGHDCRIGDDVIFAHGAVLGGHVEIGDRAFLGGGTGIHQFVRIGRLAILGGGETLTRDAPPFSAVRYDGLKGYNAVGCRRAGMSRETLHAIRSAYFCIHNNRTMPKAIEAIRAMRLTAPEVQEILDFLAGSKRGIQPSVRFSGRILHALEDND